MKAIEVDFRGKSVRLIDLASQFGLKVGTVANRYRLGWRGEELVKPIVSVLESITCPCGTVFSSFPSNSRVYCSKACFAKYTKGALIHGMSRSRLYNIWSDMKARCKGTAGELGRKYYKDKGVVVCDEWNSSFEVFRDWACANGYAENLEIDRIDPRGGYSPENCRWATRTQQMSNRHKPKRKNATSKYKGVQLTKGGKWRSFITHNGKMLHLGCFESEELAAAVYDSKAIELHGEFANTNLARSH